MPNRDRTGPLGKGPMTGRGLGKCKYTDVKLGQATQNIAEDVKSIKDKGEPRKVDLWRK